MASRGSPWPSFSSTAARRTASDRPTSDEDNEFVGLCAEFPSLSWLAASREAALTGIVKVVRQAVSDMVKDGESPPAPLTDRTYSGVFKVRVPALVHRNLVIEAAEAGVSLNRLVSAKLARG